MALPSLIALSCVRHLRRNCCEKTQEDLELFGATLPGLPFMVVGRTQHIGWTMTNVASDVIDYFTLKINPQNENQYKWDGEWIDFDMIEKRIKVKGAPDHVVKVRTSRLGPVEIENGEYLARHSVCDYPSTNLEAAFRMNTC